MSTLLTRAEFVAYLRAQPGSVFNRRIGWCCPLSVAIADKHLQPAAVNACTWTLTGTYGPRLLELTPEWASNFIRRWDAGQGINGTAAEALRLLGEDA